MSLNQKKNLSIMTLALGLFVLLTAARAGSQVPIPAVCIGLLLSLGGVLINCMSVRCPYCGKWVGRLPDEYCRGCGKMLPWDEKKDRG